MQELSDAMNKLTRQEALNEASGREIVALKEENQRLKDQRDELRS